MRKITKIRRSVKAISPVISVLLMIAIAVAASLVAYGWVSGYLDFTTTKVGKTVQIQSVSDNAVYVQNVGDSPVTIADVYVDGRRAQIGGDPYSYTITNFEDMAPSQTATIIFDDPLPTPRVNIKVVTTDGISAEYTETFSGASSSTPTPPQYTVDFVLGTGGDSMTPAAGTYSYAGDVSISATPATDYVFNQWESIGSITFADASSASTTATINGAGTITATFTYSPVVYTVEFSLGTGGDSMTPSGTGSYGGDVAVSAIPATDYVFNQWESTGSITFADSGSASTTATINSVGTITATFTYSPVLYTVDFILGTGGLSVTPDDGSYTGDITISATPDTGYEFNQWESTGSITFADASSASTTATINGAGTITATFTLIEYSVEFVLDTGGTSMTPTAGPHTYNYGDVESISATADTNYVFNEWTTTGSVVVDSPTSASTTATITGDGTVTATFTYIPPPETLTRSPTSYYDNGWRDETDAYADGGGSADSDDNNEWCIYRSYEFNIPSGATITQVRVRLDAWHSSGMWDDDDIRLEVSDGSWHSYSPNPIPLSSSQTTISCDVTSLSSGGWTPSEVNNIQVRVTHIQDGYWSDDIHLDWIPIEVTYTP